MKNPNDLFYIKQIKAGNIRAFSGIISNYQEIIFSIVLKIVSNREDAEDIVQEIFVKVFNSLENFREESEFSTWLYRIAYNASISELRKRRVSFVSISDIQQEDNEEYIENEEVSLMEIKLKFLNDALKKLSPDEIFLVTLYYYKDQSIDTIAEISNLTVANVKVKLHRIRKKLALEINRLLQNE